MVSEEHEDGEGEILRRVRAAVGPRVPIVASLDLHANVTRAMVNTSTRWSPTAPIRTSTWPTPARAPRACSSRC